MREILLTTPTFGRLCTATHVRCLVGPIKHRKDPLNIEIYGLKFDSMLNLCMHMLVPHLHLCNQAGFQDNAAKSGKPGHNRGIGPNTGPHTHTL